LRPLRPRRRRPRPPSSRLDCIVSSFARQLLDQQSNAMGLQEKLLFLLTSRKSKPKNTQPYKNTSQLFFSARKLGPRSPLPAFCLVPFLSTFLCPSAPYASWHGRVGPFQRTDILFHGLSCPTPFSDTLFFSTFTVLAQFPPAPFHPCSKIGFVRLQCNVYFHTIKSF